MPRFYTSQETQLQNLPRTYCFPNYILTGNTGDVTFSTVRVEQNQVIKAPGIPVMWKRSQPLYKTPLIAIPPPSFLFPKLLLRTKQFACYLETNHPRSEQTAGTFLSQRRWDTLKALWTSKGRGLENWLNHFPLRGIWLNSKRPIVRIWKQFRSCRNPLMVTSLAQTLVSWERKLSSIRPSK